jgi:hypothetical protein
MEARYEAGLETGALVGLRMVQPKVLESKAGHF